MLFKDIIGQNDLKKKLIGSANEGRIPHAQLFYGPAGSGKIALALAYAQYLNCSNRQPEDSCGRCASCVQFQKLAHPDLHFIYPVATTSSVKDKPKSIDFIKQWREFLISNNYYVSLNDWYEAIDIEKKQGIINKDDCNEIVRTLGYKSFEGNYKIMVIWMIEKLFHAAAPKILKIIEEPPDNTVFLLIADNVELILPTILSRSQLIRVPKIKDDDLFECLSGKYNKEEAEIQQAVNLSNGNYLEALSLLEDDNEEPYHVSFRNWMLSCYQHNVSELNSFVDEYGKMTREKLKNYLNYGIIVFRYCYQINVVKDPVIRMEGKELTFIKNFSKLIHSGNISSLFQLMNDAIYHIERNANSNILLMDLSLKIGPLLKMPASKKIS